MAIYFGLPYDVIMRAFLNRLNRGSRRLGETPGTSYETKH